MLARRPLGLWRRGWGLAALVAALALVAAACVGNADSDSDGSSPAGPTGTARPTPRPGERIEDGVIITPDPERFISTFTTFGWETDFTRHTVPYDEITRGGPSKDGIPPIDEPKFVGFAEADEFLDPGEPVTLVVVNGDARAYPLQILIWHEIVNDVVGGEPAVVTFCPLCNSALAFRRTFEGEVLDFGTSGNLRFSDLVMYDRLTETWWQQIGGDGIVGTFAGRSLDPIPASIVSYEDFKASFPQGKVLSRDTGFARSYGINPYSGYDEIGSSPFLFRGPSDGRLPAVERVVTVELAGEVVAYPFSVLDDERVVNDEVGGQLVAVFFKPGTKSALDSLFIADAKDVGAGVVFSREIDGQVLTFERDGDQFRDEETKSTWDITGKAIGGSLAGKQLEPVVHGNHFWFAWAVFQPDTRIYQGGS
jgi:hypothetical protein